MIRRCILPAVVVLFLLANASYSQEQGLFTIEPDEDMMRACPPLRTAEGKQRRQFVAVLTRFGFPFEEDELHRRVRALFDLTSRDDADTLRECLDHWQMRPGVRDVLKAHGSEGFVWCLREYLSATSLLRRGVLLEALQWFQFREAYEVLAQYLDDRSIVEDPEAIARTPAGDTHLRICDYAYNSFHSMLLRDASKLHKPDFISWLKTHSRRIRPNDLMGDRDEFISRFEDQFEGRGCQEKIRSLPSFIDDLDNRRRESARGIMRSFRKTWKENAIHPVSEDDTDSRNSGDTGPAWLYIALGFAGAAAAGALGLWLLLRRRAA